MSVPLTVECNVNFRVRAKGRRELRVGAAPPRPSVPPGRVPRVARLMALALRLDQLLRAGEIANYTELAGLGHVTRARVCQVMNLLNLSPDIQEALLFLPLVERGRDPIHLAQLQPIAMEPDWKKQRRMWQRLRAYQGLAVPAGKCPGVA